MDAVTFIYRDDIRPLLLTVYLISPVSGDNSVYFVGPDYVKISLEKIVYGEEWSDLGTVVLDGVTTDEAEDAIQLKEREVALQEENTVQFGGASGEMVEAEQDDEGVDQLYSD